MIITLVIGVSETLYATTKYQASDVLYNETIVEDTLNELYTKNDSGSIYYLGTETIFEIDTIINNYN